MTNALAGVGSNIEDRMRESVERILDLVWEVRSESFSFIDNPDIDAEVNRILALMDDGMFDDARKAAKDLLKSIEMDEWEDDAIEYAEREISGETPLFRLDMQASHLKEFLQGWIVVAAVYGLARAKVWQNLRTYLGSPFARKMWRDAGLPMPHWGRGYMNNIEDAYRRLMRDYISRAVQYAAIQKYRQQGAIGYTVHRGSTFDCPTCDSYTGRIWPLDAVVLPIHVNCMCYTKPVFNIDEA